MKAGVDLSQSPLPPKERAAVVKVIGDAFRPAPILTTLRSAFQKNYDPLDAASGSTDFVLELRVASLTAVCKVISALIPPEKRPGAAAVESAAKNLVGQQREAARRWPGCARRSLYDGGESVY